jgi:hypothetical protein
MKTIRSSHLALRFYPEDGWTRADAESYLLSGGIEWTGWEFGMYANSPEGTDYGGYWRPTMRATMNCPKIVQDNIEIDRYPGYVGTATDLAYLMNYN